MEGRDGSTGGDRRATAHAPRAEPSPDERSLLDRLAVGFYLACPAGTVYYVNPAMARLYGYSRGDALLAEARPRWPDEANRAWWQSGGPPPEGTRTSEWQQVREDGAAIWVRETVQCLRDGEGRVVRVEGTLEAITEQKRAQEAQALLTDRQSVRLQRLSPDGGHGAPPADDTMGEGELSQVIQQRFLDSLTETYWFYRHDRHGEFIYMSPSVHRVLGYTAEDYCTHYASLFTPDPVNTAAVRCTERALLGERQPPYEVEVVAKDGSVHRLEVTEYPVRGADGQVEFVEGMARDITQKWRAERSLRESEEKYRSFFEEDLAGSYVATPDGRVLACNPSLAAILGFESVKTALGPNLWSHYPDRAAADAFLGLLRTHGRLKNHEHELRRQDGARLRVIQNTVGRFDGRGVLVEIHGYIVDDTERSQAEQQLRQSQKMEAVGQLAGGIAHDFNNLLGVIIGFTELLERDMGFQHPGQARLEQIRKAADRAAGLTRQLLAFSRKQVLQPRVIDLNAVVGEMEELLRRLIGEDIQLTTALDASLGRTRVDPAQVEQVIVNLAVNARDAMLQGGRLLIQTENVLLDDAYVRVHPGSRPGPHLMLEVRDTGHGMEPEILSRVFEPFFTTKAAGKGTGLGLSTAYGIIKQSGGFIGLESKPGAGSSFKIYFPRVDGAAAVIRAETLASPAPVPGGSETVLLLEDEHSLRAVIREFLEAAGYSVLECALPQEALVMGQASARTIHLMLTDVVMPGMSGREVAERILTVRPQMKVLYMSGYTEKAISHHGVLDPGMEFIPKPFAANAVLRRVRELLDRRPS